MNFEFETKTIIFRNGMDAFVKHPLFRYSNHTEDTPNACAFAFCHIYFMLRFIEWENNNAKHLDRYNCQNAVKTIMRILMRYSYTSLSGWLKQYLCTIHSHETFDLQHFLNLFDNIVEISYHRFGHILRGMWQQYALAIHVVNEKH